MNLPDSEQGFPTTRWSVIRGANDPASTAYRQSLEHLAAAYWAPIYAYFRRKWGRSGEEARDLTQEFFAALCERDFLSRLSPELGRFRAYVRVALDNFARNDHRAQSRMKRGGGRTIVPLERMVDFEPASGDSPEQVFEREWARSILGDALQELEREYQESGQEAAYRLFAWRDMESPGEEDVSYKALARRFGMSTDDVTNILYRARKKLRELVLKRVRDTVTTEDEAEAEMRELFAEPDPE